MQYKKTFIIVISSLITIYLFACCCFAILCWSRQIQYITMVQGVSSSSSSSNTQTLLLALQSSDSIFESSFVCSATALVRDCRCGSRGRVRAHARVAANVGVVNSGSDASNAWLVMSSRAVAGGVAATGKATTLGVRAGQTSALGLVLFAVALVIVGASDWIVWLVRSLRAHLVLDLVHHATVVFTCVAASGVVVSGLAVATMLLVCCLLAAGVLVLVSTSEARARCGRRHTAMRASQAATWLLSAVVVVMTCAGESCAANCSGSETCRGSWTGVTIGEARVVAERLCSRGETRTRLVGVAVVVVATRHIAVAVASSQAGTGMALTHSTVGGSSNSSTRGVGAWVRAR